MFGELPAKLPQQIAFLLVPNFSMIAFTSAVEPMRLANRVSGKELYRWHLFSPDGKPVAGQQRHPADARKARSSRSSITTPSCLCSGIDGHLYEDKNVFAHLRRAERQGADIGALCTGSAYPGQGQHAQRLSLHHPLGESRELCRELPGESKRPPNSSRSTATASPVQAARRRST